MPVYTSPQDGTTLDAWMNSQSTTQQNGTSVTFNIGERNDGAVIWRTWMAFPGLNDGSIPAQARVISATFYFLYYGNLATTTPTMEVYRCRRSDASVSQLTWMIYKTSNNWGTGGAGNTTTDREETSIGTVLCSTSASFQSCSLAVAPIQEMINGTWTTNSFIIKAETELNNGYQFHSSNAVSSANRPYISVEYEVGYPKIFIF